MRNPRGSAPGPSWGQSRQTSLIISADDFGLSTSVNEGVEQAHREGMLSTASLMVAGAAASDAVLRAKRNPALRVGLHLVAIEGPAVLPPLEVPHLVDPDGQFGSDQATLGFRYQFNAATRRELAREVDAQFRAFAATGLTLDHANAHKHMHLHPTVGRLLIDIGRRYGLRSVRVPSEPPLTACGTEPTFGDATLRAWTRRLRTQVRRAGLATTDHCFGLAWSGGMTRRRLSCLLGDLPPGSSEIYFHPASARDPLLDRLMPCYDHEGELGALLDPALGRLVQPLAVTWSDISPVDGAPAIRTRRNA